MIFLFGLSTSVALATFFQSARISLGIVFGGVLWFILGGMAEKRKGAIRQLFLLIVGVVIGILSVRYKHWSYDDGELYKNTFVEVSGSIVQVSGEGKYIFRDLYEKEYIYYSKQTYAAGDTLYAHVQIKLNIVQNIFAPVGEPHALYAKAGELIADERGFEAEKRMLMKGYHGVMYEKSLVEKHSNEASFLLSVRSWLSTLFSRLYEGRVLGLSLAMLTGDRSLLSSDDYSAFVDSGLVHIIAVSGGNIVLLVSFLSILTFFLPYYIRMVFLGVAIIAYASLCGWDSSVLRATLMALCSMGALFFGRSIHIWRSIAYVYVVMLWRNPYYLLYDLGFIFSFTALIGIVVFSQRWSFVTTKKSWQGSVKKTLIHYIKCFRNNYILPSMAAALGIFTPLLFFTGRINVLSILSNILIVPAVPFVMIYGFCGAFIYSLTEWQWLLYPQAVAIKRIYAVSDWTIVHGVVIYAQTGRARISILILMSVIITTIIVASHRSKKHTDN